MVVSTLGNERKIKPGDLVCQHLYKQDFEDPILFIVISDREPHMPYYFLDILYKGKLLDKYLIHSDDNFEVVSRNEEIK